jgi:16S rRNA (adenine1518-N6/adenine1519-N6)-dimethyltransferase
MKLTEMKQVLAARQIQLTKSLGQNFLHDPHQLQRIADAAELHAGDRVLEIGPGLGPLTAVILGSGAEVLAIEKDHRLYEFLKEGLAGESKLTLLCTDALKYLRSHPSDWSDWKLVANLPYSVASPILVELAKARGCPERLVATLQMEVAQRLMATAEDRDYGVLSLLVQLRYEPRSSFRIPSSCFFPAPDVDSACVTLVRRLKPLLDPGEIPVFERIVKRGFSQRRKMMMKLLKEDWPKDTLEITFQKMGISPSIRAEKVTLEQFIQLTRALNGSEQSPALGFKEKATNGH